MPPGLGGRRSGGVGDHRRRDRGRFVSKDVTTQRHRGRAKIAFKLEPLSFVEAALGSDQPCDGILCPDGREGCTSGIGE
jgi:hypothetical protein